MNIEEHTEKVRREIEEARTRASAWRAQQAARKARLLGGDDQVEWQAPAPLADFDSLLGEHAAQLKNAARMVMGQVLDDGTAQSAREQAVAVAGLTRIVQTTLAIARALGSNGATAKTVHSAAAMSQAQD